MKRLLSQMILLCMALSLIGCMSVSKSYDKAEMVAMKKSKATFNPSAVYQIPPGGAVLEDLVDMQTMKRTGPIRVPAGAIVYYDAELVDGKL